MRHSLLGLSLCALLCASTLQPARAFAATTDTREAGQDDRTAWFRDARFGMFIHWGLYSIPAGEYRDPKTGAVSTNHAEWYLESTQMPVSEYEKFLPRFDPVKFDAEKWAQIAADAGVRYVCITSKHHDGFAMFPSKVTEGWHFGLTPMGRAGRDPLMELKVACKKRGIAFCLYHTIMDWHSADYAARRSYNDLPGMKAPADMDRFQKFLEASTSEVIGRYHPKMMWFDGFWEKPWTLERGRALQSHLRRLAPGMIINDRVGPTAASTSGLGNGEFFGDYATPEQFIPTRPIPGGRPWETCMTLNDHWGFNKADHHWKSSETLIRNLVEVVSKGGNLLLNVGPDASGEIPEASVTRLADMGRWLKVNGESVYGASASPFGRLPWGTATTKSGVVYLHVTGLPENKRILIPVTGIEVTRLTALADGKSVPFTAGPGGLTADLSAVSEDRAVTVLKLVSPGPVRQGVIPSADGSLSLQPGDAEISGSALRVEERPHRPSHLGYWTDAADSARWSLLGVSAGRYRAVLDYACDADSAGAEVALAVAGAASPVRATIRATGKGWEEFKSVDCGEITLPAGDSKLTVSAVSKPGYGVANIRSLRLVPVK